MRVPTSVLAAAGLIAVPCVAIWARRHTASLAVALAVLGIAAFALSHALGVLIGAWPAVLLTAAVTATAYWRLSDSRTPGEPTRALV